MWTVWAKVGALLLAGLVVLFGGGALVLRETSSEHAGRKALNARVDRIDAGLTKALAGGRFSPATSDRTIATLGGSGGPADPDFQVLGSGDGPAGTWVDVLVSTSYQPVFSFDAQERRAQGCVRFRVEHGMAGWGDGAHLVSGSVACPVTPRIDGLARRSVEIHPRPPVCYSGQTDPAVGDCPGG